jgi:hypothetical protein
MHPIVATHWGKWIAIGILLTVQHIPQDDVHVHNFQNIVNITIV